MPAAPHRVLSLIAPMTQLNTPYPSTAYITGFLRSRGVHAVQADLALALILKLLSPTGLQQVRDAMHLLPPQKHTPVMQQFDAEFTRYTSTLLPTLAFLQGRDPTLALV
jgi:hypothetical protein